jgi:hypothetical protein
MLTENIVLKNAKIAGKHLGVRGRCPNGSSGQIATQRHNALLRGTQIMYHHLALRPHRRNDSSGNTGQQRIDLRQLLLFKHRQLQIQIASLLYSISLRFLTAIVTAQKDDALPINSSESASFDKINGQIASFDNPHLSSNFL